MVANAAATLPAFIEITDPWDAKNIIRGEFTGMAK